MRVTHWGRLYESSMWVTCDPLLWVTLGSYLLITCGLTSGVICVDHPMCHGCGHVCDDECDDVCDDVCRCWWGHVTGDGPS